MTGDARSVPATRADANGAGSRLWRHWTVRRSRAETSSQTPIGRFDNRREGDGHEWFRRHAAAAR